MIQSESICNIVAATKRKTRSIEFSPKYTKLAILAIKTYVGKSELNLAIPPVGIEQWASCDPVSCLLPL